MNKTINMKKAIITIPLWERDVTLIVGGDFNEILKEAKRLKLSVSVEREILKDKLSGTNARGGAYFCLDKGEGILWFPATGRVLPGTYGHEFTHFVDWLSVFIGMETEMEARAYTIDFLFDKIPPLVKKLRK